MQQPADFTGNSATLDSAVQQQLAQLQAQVSALQATSPAATHRHGYPSRFRHTGGTHNYGNSRGPPKSNEEIQCRACGGYGHVRSQCANTRNQQYDKGQSPSGVGEKRKLDNEQSGGRPSPYKAVTFDPSSCNYPPRGTGAPRTSGYRAAAGVYGVAEDGPVGDVSDTVLQAQRAAMLWQQQEDEEGDDN